MDTRQIERLAKFASHVASMKFYEFDGRLSLQGLFDSEMHDVEYVKALAQQLNEAIKSGLHSVQMDLLEQIRHEVGPNTTSPAAPGGKGVE